MVLRHRAPPVLSSSLLRLPGGISRHAPRRAIPPFNLGRPAMNGFEPTYLALDRRGELEERARRALVLLGPERCVVCPRECKVDRLADHPGLCRVGRHAVVASHFPHFGEENCLRGERGSGTIFFSGCNLRCVFCQNHDISWQLQGERATPRRLAAMMLELQAIGCHNINWVTPEHVEDEALLRGAGRFLDALDPAPGAHHAAVLRSSEAHARLVRLDATRALRIPGVTGVLTGA